jgi:hypothetical protein
MTYTLAQRRGRRHFHRSNAAQCLSASVSDTEPTCSCYREPSLQRERTRENRSFLRFTPKKCQRKEATYGSR